jgi:CRISPR/Cas system-associated endonuclease Cas1
MANYNNNPQMNQGQGQMPPNPQNYNAYPQGNYPNQNQQGGYYPQQQRAVMDEKAHIEEIAEAIIDEKWEDLLKNINQITDWKEKTESNISKLEQELKDLKDSFDKLHKAIIGKIGEYDQNILNVGTEIKAMEKVFQKVLPAFTENVNELSRITKTAKLVFSNKNDAIGHAQPLNRPSVNTGSERDGNDKE